MHIRPQHHQQRGGFTLVEIIIVVMLIGMIMAWGVPTFVQTFKRQPLQQAVNDFIEACASARASAILTGVTAELVVTAGEGGTTSFQVRGGAATSIDPLSGESSTGGGTGFSGSLPPTIGLEMLAVNFQDAVTAGEGEVRVRFFPNGTCDEFTIVMLEPSTNKRRMIRLDVITGHADLKTEEQIAQLKK
jgi:prepilin-type N-terminal cleavage/methylation domain-containing protein